MSNLFLLLIGLFSLMSSFSAMSSVGPGTGLAQLTTAVRDIYSREIFFQAQPRLKFAQFAKVRRDFQAIRGGTIVFTKYNNLSGGGEVAEDANINRGSLASSEVSISVTEQGNAVTLTEKLLQLSFQDVMGDASRLLANDLAISIDTMLRDAALQTPNAMFGDGSTLANVTDFNTATGTTGQFSVETVRSAVEFLSNNNAPRIQGEYYVCFATAKQIRQIKSDADWLEVNKYNGRRQIYAGEVGMYDGVVFIETTQMPSYDTAAEAVAAGWSDVTVNGTQEAVFFGENAYAWGIALDPELRDDGVNEFGRHHALAWYGIWGAGILEERNIIKVLTRNVPHSA